MSAQCNNFRFDPQKSALENFFAMIYRNNKIRLTAMDVAVELPEPLEGDPDGDNTKIHIRALPGAPFAGEDHLYYARADLDEYYPVFELDITDLEGVNDKDALMAYIDGRFDLINGEFDIDIEDPIGSLMAYTSIDLIAKDRSLVYIGKKSINIFWSGGMRRVTDEGRIRVTEDGQFRVLEL